MDNQAGNTTVRYHYPYCPPGVTEVIGLGSSTYIGAVDESTVFKYPVAPGEDLERLEIERKFFEIIGSHERIIGFKGYTESGLYLERARNGDLGRYLDPDNENPVPSIQQRLAWCREAAEAVAWIHSRRVLHCDLHPLNLLLDNGLHVKLADFQGRQLSETGEIILNGWSSEPTRFHCPRNDEFDADYKTDLFALGCTIYFIIMGDAVFSDIINGEDRWREKVKDRFQKQQWPQEQHLCSAITLRCWKKEYESAQEIVEDIKCVERSVDPGPVVRSWRSFLFFPLTIIRWGINIPTFFKNWASSMLGLRKT